MNQENAPRSQVPTHCDGLSWEARCEYWLAASHPPSTRFRREQETNPLILTGHGLSLRVEKGSLLVRDGNTHFPVVRRQWHFFNGGLDIPPAIVVIDGSGEITLDAIDWLATQGVPLIRLRWDGQFTSVISTGGQAASTDKVRWQEKTRQSAKLRVAFGLELIKQKAHSTLITLEQSVPRSPVWASIHKNISIRTRWLHDRPPRQLRKLLGIEGAIAEEYFRAWSGISLKWRATKQYPIPDDWRKFGSRAALRGDQHRKQRATHPVNAMLNYAYAVLTSRLQISLIADGYDPTLGIMHDQPRIRGSYPALALDYIEPMRPVVDRAILDLVATETFTGADFSIQHDGVCRLNPELARRVTQLAMNETTDTPM